MNNPFSTLTKKEWLLWLCSLFIVLVSNILAANFDPLTLIAALVGVTSLVFAAKGNVWAQVLMIVFLIGVLAVGLSTANALLMVMSSIIYKDLLVGIGHCKFKTSETSVIRVVILLFGAVTVAVSLMHWEYVYNLMIFADSLVESLFPALVFGIYCKWATRKAAITSISVGAIIICLTFFVWDLGYVWYGTIGLATAFVLMYVVSKLTKDDPKDSEDFYEALDSGHRRFMRIKAKIK